MVIDKGAYKPPPSSKEKEPVSLSHALPSLKDTGCSLWLSLAGLLWDIWVVGRTQWIQPLPASLQTHPAYKGSSAHLTEREPGNCLDTSARSVSHMACCPETDRLLIHPQPHSTNGELQSLDNTSSDSLPPTCPWNLDVSISYGCYNK